MARDIAAVEKIDPRFDIPEGLYGLVTDDTEYDADPSSIDMVVHSDAIFTDNVDDDDVVYDEDSMEDSVESPDSIAIVSQTVRTAPDGSQVVDVVIDVAEVFGAANYEVRITKA